MAAPGAFETTCVDNVCCHTLNYCDAYLWPVFLSVREKIVKLAAVVISF